MPSSILVLGALGQVGTDLTLQLRSLYGNHRVVISDLQSKVTGELAEGPFEAAHDCMDDKRTAEIIQKYKVDCVYHLPALLSVTAERFPQKAFEINLIGLYKTLEVLRLCRPSCGLFFPSTIGAFGKTTPKIHTPQDTLMQPSTMYGITKLSGELLCDYYALKYGLDTRGVRYPGIISHKVIPAGGTTDYAIQIFHDALAGKPFVSYLRADCRLDMLYVPDAIQAAIQLMEADPSKLIHRNGFNVTAMSFDVQTIAKEIQKHLPDVRVVYEIDPVKQAIADSWPDQLDDTAARQEWGWNPTYSLEHTVADMLQKLREKQQQS